MPLHRVFIAFPVSSEAKEELQKIQNELEPLNRHGRIRWTKPEGMHVTLEFLGEITTDFVTRIAQILKTLSTKYMTFKFKLESVDAFPNKYEPKVIVVKVKDEAGDSYRLQKELHNELQALNLKLDNKNWHPHITLGRNKFHHHVQGLNTIEVKKIVWEVDKVELIESELLPDGPRYKVLSTHSLCNSGL